VEERAPRRLGRPWWTEHRASGFFQARDTAGRANAPEPHSRWRIGEGPFFPRFFADRRFHTSHILHGLGSVPTVVTALTALPPGLTWRRASARTTSNSKPCWCGQGSRAPGLLDGSVIDSGTGKALRSVGNLTLLRARSLLCVRAWYGPVLAFSLAPSEMPGQARERQPPGCQGDPGENGWHGPALAFSLAPSEMPGFRLPWGGRLRGFHLPALRRQSRVHPGRRAAVQRQCGELQRLICYYATVSERARRPEQPHSTAEAMTSRTGWRPGRRRSSTSDAIPGAAPADTPHP
jgi:hypothetical protein